MPPCSPSLSGLGNFAAMRSFAQLQVLYSATSEHRLNTRERDSDMTREQP